jgi:hypothetical protein
MASVSILEVRPDGFVKDGAGVTPRGQLISRAPDTAPRRNPGVLHNVFASRHAAIRKRRTPGMENGARTGRSE